MRPVDVLLLLLTATPGRRPDCRGFLGYPRRRPGLCRRLVLWRRLLQNMGASALVNGTRRGYGKSTPKERQRKEVTILDIFGNAASAKAGMAEWIDYMQLARIDGRWVIVNVLWERGPG
jgi:hypothetical protein